MVLVELDFNVHEGLVAESAVEPLCVVKISIQPKKAAHTVPEKRIESSDERR
jgi:hypothetical protein